MPKAKKRAPGEFAPTQFATCIENGLNIHAQTKPSASSNSSDKNKKKEASKSKGTKHNIVETPAAKETAAKRKLNQKYPRIECTNGAMEALQLCHSEFIKATSTALVALESSKLKNEKDADAAAAASSKKKVSFSATTKTVTYNEDHVVQCMKKMGFSNLVERAMKSLNTGSSKQSHTNNKVKQSKRQLKQPASKPPPSAQNKKRKRKSNPLDDAALLAEQERLLSESAKRVYHNHNQQQQQQQQKQQKQTDEQSQAVAATSNDLGSSGDAGGALV